LPIFSSVAVTPGVSSAARARIGRQAVAASPARNVRLDIDDLPVVFLGGYTVRLGWGRIFREWVGFKEGFFEADEQR
jgi:hypothetical protein